MSDLGEDYGLRERIELSLLYDFYGALLKENQRRMFEAGVLDDCSLSEIAENEGITRQGVYDAVKRAARQLRSYEEKLGLAAKFEKKKKLAAALDEKLRLVSAKYDGGDWDDIFKILDEILEE